jgi:hypothetical protein
MDAPGTVSISIERLKELEDAEAMLSALYAAGVDSWEGYSDAIESIESE